MRKTLVSPAGFDGLEVKDEGMVLSRFYFFEEMAKPYFEKFHEPREYFFSPDVTIDIRNKFLEAVK